MSTDMLHDQSGEWIGFRVDSRYVYSAGGTLVGWCLEDQPDVVVGPNGSYLGEVVEGNRLFRRTSPPFFPSVGYLPNPGGPSMPSNPGNVGYASFPSGMEDVPKDLLPGA
jgi:hypothetical protein